MTVQEELDAIRFQILRALKRTFDNGAMCPERSFSEVAKETDLAIETVMQQAQFLHVTGHIQILTNEEIQLTTKGYALISPSSPFVDQPTKQEQASVFLNTTIVNAGNYFVALKEEIARDPNLSSDQKAAWGTRLSEFLKHPFLLEAARRVLDVLIPK
ncbi:MAG: hypothetical protein MN733_09615 [Nitrososphaera sp.]|nr:hypothetical protein [Nitrososphaera sp.]